MKTSERNAKGLGTITKPGGSLFIRNYFFNWAILGQKTDISSSSIIVDALKLEELFQFWD